MVKIDICNKVNEIITNQIEKFLSQQRETYSIVKEYFGEENTDFIINDKLHESVELHKLINYIAGATDIYSDDYGYESYKRLHCLFNYILDIKSNLSYESDKSFDITTLLNILFNKKSLTITTYSFLISKPTKLKEYFYKNEEEKVLAINLLFSDITTIMMCKVMKGLFKLRTGNMNFFATSYILIKFDKITIKNENNNSHTIYDTYIKLILLPHEIIDYFDLARGSMTKSEYIRNYSHSHANGNAFSFCNCCLGSGPLDETTIKLKAQFSHTKKYLIELFCFELENYLQVESLAGVPYHKLTELTNRSSKLITSFNDISLLSEIDDIFIDFYKWILLKHNDKLHFIINDRKILLGMTFSEIIVTFTNLFSIYIKEKSIEDSVILKYCINSTISSIGYTIYSNDNTTVPTNILVCNFKNNPIFSKEITTLNNNEIIILNPNIIGVLINKILTFLNFNYV